MNFPNGGMPQKYILRSKAWSNDYGHCSLVLFSGSVQNLLASFRCAVRKILYRIFPCMAVLTSSSKVLSYHYKTKNVKTKNFNRTAISRHHRKQVGAITCPMYKRLRRYPANPKDKYRHKKIY